jgi:superkiller protein 3
MPYIDEGNRAYQKGDFEGAIRHYQESIDTDENPALAYFNMGNTYYQMEEIAKAIVCYRSSLFEAPDFARAYLNLGVLYFNMEYMPGTISVLQRALALDPDNSQARLILSSAYGRLEAYPQSVIMAEKALERDTSQGDAFFLLSAVARQLGDPDEAEYWLQRYPDAGPRVREKYQWLAELAEEYRGAEEAVANYRRLIEINPDNRWAHYRLVKNLFDMGNHFVALENTAEALRRFPEFDAIALLGGNLAFEAGILRRAEEFYSRAGELGNAGGYVGLQNLIKKHQSLGNDAAVDRINRIILSIQSSGG